MKKDEEFDRVAGIMVRFGATAAYPQTLVDFSRFSSDFDKPVFRDRLSRPIFWIKPDSNNSQAGALTAGGYLVHVLKMNYPTLKLPRRKAGSWVLHPRFPIKRQHIKTKGVTASHGEGIAWDYICIHSSGGGLNPTQHPRQAMFVKDQKNGEKKYTFRGVYEADIASSDEFKITYRRIANKVDETDKDWRIVGFAAKSLCPVRSAAGLVE
ncbi:MAG: hypothetical protein LBB83_00125 [Treponema sp.]|jgi:hypothetical protein|nr:hypothetical protein [Treponema sp.]